MKKFFIFFLMLFYCLLPQSVYAESGAFLTEESFKLVKAFKLGRSQSSPISGQSQLSNKGAETKLAKECNEYCSSCDTTTGQCIKCDNNRYLKNNFCLVCFANATCDGVVASCNAGFELNGDSCTETDVACNAWKPETGGHYWNADGAHTIPDNVKCWNGYGATASISVPNASYESATIRFHQGATVSGSFTAKQLRIVRGCGTNNPGNVTFNSAVTVTGYVELTKGTSAIFKNGLKGSPACKVEEGTSRCPVASGGTCTCTTSKCYTN